MKEFQLKIRRILEEQGKEVFQQVKEMKKVYIFKWMCQQRIYWEYNYAIEKPQIFSKPDNDDKGIFIRKAASYIFSKDKTINKITLASIIKKWEEFYKQNNGCLGTGQYIYP